MWFKLASAVAVASLMVVHSAAAADLTPRYKAPEAAPAYLEEWSGFYLGIEGGYGWNRGNLGIGLPGGPADFGDLSNAPQGALVGGFVGYNYHVPNSIFVFGLEGGGDWAHLAGTTAMPVPVVATTNGDWLASARVRLGFLISDLLIYGTVGGGWGSQTLDITTPVGAPMTSATSTLTGLAWGVGLEHALFQNFHIRLQYLQYDFGTLNAPCPPAQLNCPATVTFTQKDRVDTVTLGGSIRF